MRIVGEDALRASIQAGFGGCLLYHILCCADQCCCHWHGGRRWHGLLRLTIRHPQDLQPPYWTAGGQLRLLLGLKEYMNGQAIGTLFMYLEIMLILANSRSEFTIHLASR